MQSKSQKKTAHYSHISRMASPVEDVHGGDGPNDHDAAGGAAAASKKSLKKGPWTAAEDAMLIEYVRRHGEGNWNAVQRNSGLQRCGKSCRLRWANHLRPNLKKGAFTPEEERLILELHAKFGNKWARMASQLPGRTDNEIKNYWNTRMKRRLRAGLPLYPVDIQREASQFIRQPQHHHHHNHHRQNRLQKHQKQPEKKIEFSAQMISSTYNNDNNSPSHHSFIDQINFLSPQNTIQSQQNPSYFTLPIQEFNFICDASNTTNAAKNNNNSNSTNGFVLPLLSHISRHHLVSSYPGPNNPSSTPLFDQSFSTQLWTNSASTPLQQQLGFVPLLNANQSPIRSSTSPAAGVGCNHNVVGGNPKSGYEIERPALYQGNSGLLEDMLKDVQLRSSTSNNNENRNEEEISFELDKDNENNNNGVVSCKNDNQLALEISGMHGGLLWKENSETTPGNQLDDSTSGQSSTGMKKKPRVEVNALDDELTSLLNSFPSSSPIQQWYHRNGEMSNGESSSRFTTGHDVVMDVGHDQTAPSPPPISADENDCNAMDQSLNLGTTICHSSTTTIY